MFLTNETSPSRCALALLWVMRNAVENRELLVLVSFEAVTAADCVKIFHVLATSAASDTEPIVVPSICSKSLNTKAVFSRRFSAGFNGLVVVSPLEVVVAVSGAIDTLSKSHMVVPLLSFNINL